MNRHRLARLFALVLFAGFSLTAIIAGKRGLADILAQEPRYDFDRWLAGKVSLDSKAAATLVISLRTSLSIDPNNPDLLSDLARAESWRARNGNSNDPEIRASREAALDNFRRAARLRPSSGHSWVNVALAKFNLGRIDSEYAATLDRAMLCAPWQPQVQLIGIQLGLASWPGLTNQMQQSIGNAIHAQAEWKLVDQKPALIKLLKAFQRPDLACPWAGAAFPCSCG